MIEFPKNALKIYDLKDHAYLNIPDGEPFPFSTVLCLGNFDGIHKGHKALIERTVSESKALSAKCSKVLSGAWFFSQTTKKYFDNSESFGELTTLDEKLAILESYGLDYAFIADFPSFRDLAPEEFVCEILKSRCSCVSVVCGYDFRFGQKGAGTAKLLSELFDGNCNVIDRVTHDGVTVASTVIRNLLKDGDIESANAMLGYGYSLNAEVVYGKQLGSKLGFPTANVRFPSGKMIPRLGVYATIVAVEGIKGRFIGVTNIGVNPTVNDNAGIICETFILDFDGDIYGKRIKIEFQKMLREEKKFSSLEELTSEIAKNKKQAEELLRAHI